MIALLLLGCPDTSPPAARSPSRGDAVLVDPKRVTPPEAFCDRHHPEASAPPFPVVVLDGAAWTKPTTWRWVNVWATWCGPCVEEMPRIRKWQDRLAQAGHPAELVLVSVDQGRAEVSRFYDKHPDFPPTVRVADYSTVPAWLGELGLDATTPIPVHVFVDPANRVRCIRTGALGEHDYPTIASLLGG